MDGTGARERRADVGISRDRIAALGELSGSSAATEIDADGRTVAPGFIDVHTHSDLTVLVNGRAESKIRQGVTTEVTGNCSFSPYPVRPGRPVLVERYELRTALAGIEWDWSDLDGYARRVESAGTSVNIAPLVGQASVRIAVMGGGDGRPTPEQLDEMQRLVEQALEQGAFGMSVELTLVPPGFAETDELIALAEPLGRYGRLYVQHSRLWAGWHAKTIEEAEQIGRAAGCGVCMTSTHTWPAARPWINWCRPGYRMAALRRCSHASRTPRRAGARSPIRISAGSAVCRSIGRSCS